MTSGSGLRIGRPESRQLTSSDHHTRSTTQVELSPGLKRADGVGGEDQETNNGQREDETGWGGGSGVCLSLKDWTVGVPALGNGSG